MRPNVSTLTHLAEHFVLDQLCLYTGRLLLPTTVVFLVLLVIYECYKYY